MPTLTPSRLLTWAVLISALALATRVDAIDALGLELTPMQTDYVLYEPVFVDVSLRNTGGAAVEVPKELSLETQMSTFYIAPADGAWQPVEVGLVGEPRDIKVRLEPGGTYMGSQLLLYSPPNGAHLFPEPGTWKIRAVFHRFGFAPDVDSNVTEITVVRPTGVDAEAAALFSAGPVVELVMNTREDPAGVNTLEEIIANYPDSRFADYAHFYLARREAQAYFDRRPNPLAAIAHLEALINGPRHAPQIEAAALEMLGKLYEATGQPGQASNTYGRLRREHPDSASSAAIAERFHRLAQERAASSSQEQARPVGGAEPTHDSATRAGQTRPTPTGGQTASAPAHSSRRWLATVLLVALVLGGLAVYRSFRR